MTVPCSTSPTGTGNCSTGTQVGHTICRPCERPHKGSKGRRKGDLRSRGRSERLRAVLRRPAGPTDSRMRSTLKHLCNNDRIPLQGTWARPIRVCAGQPTALACGPHMADSTSPCIDSPGTRPAPYLGAVKHEAEGLLALSLAPDVHLVSHREDRLEAQACVHGWVGGGRGRGGRSGALGRGPGRRVGMAARGRALLWDVACIQPPPTRAVSTRDIQESLCASGPNAGSSWHNAMAEHARTLPFSPVVVSSFALVLWPVLQMLRTFPSVKPTSLQRIVRPCSSACGWFRWLYRMCACCLNWLVAAPSGAGANT